MDKHIEKQILKYIVATMDIPTQYVRSLGWGKYAFTDNIEYATKTLRRSYAEDIKNDCAKSDLLHEFVVIPVEVTFSLINEI